MVSQEWMKTFYDDNGYLVVKSLFTDDELVGMRERARAVGGSVLTVAQTDGTWRVAARLPLQVAT